MPYFSDLPIKVKEQLTRYFERAAVGTKLKYGQSISIDAQHQYVLKNSYIKLNNDVYALAKGDGAVLGQGAYGRVKYVRSLSTDKIFAAKILPFTPSDEAVADLENELGTLDDLGLYRDTGGRSAAEQHKQYVVMLDTGMSLQNYITTHQEFDLTSRLDLAIKFCWIVYQLHQGLSSRTLTPYAHCDLKPANVTLDSEGGMHLIDLGTASRALDKPPKDLVGSPAYLPNILTYIRRQIILRQQDIVALKRVIYMPENLLCLAGYKEDKTGKHFGIDMLLSQEVLNHLNLLKYFDTSVRRAGQKVLDSDQCNGDPIILASLLVLARYNLLDAYGEQMSNPILASAVLGRYFADQGFSDEVAKKNITLSITAYVLERVAPRHHSLADQVRFIALLVAHGITYHLDEAVKSKALIHLINGSTPTISHAAALLWNNGFYEDVYFTKLHDNEELAKFIIKCVFDGNISEIKKIMPHEKKIAEAKLDRAPLTLPAISQAPRPIASETYKVPSMLSYLKKLKPEEGKSDAKAPIHLPPLFVAPPKTGTVIKDSVMPHAKRY